MLSSRFFTTMLLTQLYVRSGILLTCLKHLHDCIISLWSHKNSLNLPLLTEVSVPNQDSEQYMYIRGIHFTFVSTNFLLNLGTVLTVWYFFY
jgi:hypothetical protein